MSSTLTGGGEKLTDLKFNTNDDGGPLKEDANERESEDDKGELDEGEIEDESASEDVASNIKNTTEASNAVNEFTGIDTAAHAPPLPEEDIPPLPEENTSATATAEDDGWDPVWEPSVQAFYFYNRFTGATQWANPRVPETAEPPAPGVEPSSSPAHSLDEPPPSSSIPPLPASDLSAGSYNPAIHGDYDPSAWYAQPAAPREDALAKPADSNAAYAATAAFNRFTGRFQNSDLTPENFNDENKSKRQMNAFFDVDAAANSHEGRSLKAERSGKKLSKTELKQFKEKRKAKKEEKRRAWLRD